VYPPGRPAEIFLGKFPRVEDLGKPVAGEAGALLRPGQPGTQRPLSPARASVASLRGERARCPLGFQSFLLSSPFSFINLVATDAA
jgi:hypothetical protein